MVEEKAEWSVVCRFPKGGGGDGEEGGLGVCTCGFSWVSGCCSGFCCRGETDQGA